MNEYVIDINGIEHTIQLSDADAKARGLQPASKAAAAPADKARKTVTNKSKG